MAPRRLSKDQHHHWPRPTSHRIYHDPRYLSPRNHKHECTTHFNLGGREIRRHAWRAQCCLCFRSSVRRPNSNCTALELWLQFIASRVLPRKPLLTRFQAQACLIENNQRGLSVWGRPPMKEWGRAGPGRLGAPKWKPNGQLDGEEGVLVRVPRIADSV